MKITPLEIRQKTFEKKLRGYDKDEVDAYLQALSFEWERLNNETRDLKSKLDHTEADVAKLREVESSLYKALKTAEDTSSNIVDQANKTAELHLKEVQMDAEALMNEAKFQAKNMIEEAEEAVKSAVDQVKYELQQLEQDYKLLENQRDNLLSDLKAIANESLEKATRYQDRFSSAKFSLPKIEVNTENPFTSPLNEVKATPVEAPKMPSAEEKTEEPPITSMEFEVNTSYVEEMEEKKTEEVVEPITNAAEKVSPTVEEPQIEKTVQAEEVKKTPTEDKSENDEQSSFFDQI